MPDIFDNYSYPHTSSNPIIYVYSESYLKGYLKVGYTTQPVEKRMQEIHPLNTPIKTWKVLYTEPALYDDGTTFTDHEVHRVLESKGIKRSKDYKNNKDTEFFKCTLNDVKAAIVAVKTHTLNEENRTATFKMRPEQIDAVEKTSEYFLSERKKEPNHSAKYLWNCKMRFGKTFASYELAKKMGMKRILILTFKPAVEDSWETDLLTHVDFVGWQFYSRKYGQENKITPKDLDQNRPIVCFGSFQDFLGTNDNGGIKAKNEWVHTINWDMVIFDEYHFGAWRDSAKKLFYKEDEDNYDSLDIEKYKEEEADNAYNESFLPITTKYYLFLSGTPFRAINTGEFLENQIYSWTYSDEQQAKEDWPKKHPDEPNPYAALPRMVMMTYQMPPELERVATAGEFDEFDLNVFFQAVEKEKGNPNSAEFIHKNEVQHWLDMIRGSYLPTSLDNLRNKGSDRPVMPFSDTRMLANLQHTLWFLPNVDSCYAMRNLLAERQNTFYHDYRVNLCAGSQAGIGLDAVKPVRKSMDPPLETKTITLSCGKLTTGVTIRPWSAIFMLRNLSSPETYFQAAFRVQSPWTIKRDDGSEEIIKHDCYILDFAVNRALKEVADYSCRLNIHESNPERKVGDFIKFLPVLAYDGSAMKSVNAGDILDIVTAGTSASLLARRWESALLVNVDNTTLKNLMENEEAMNALMNIEDFRNLNHDIETVINKSEHVKNAKTKDKDLDPEEHKKLSEEEIEYRQKRRQIQKKLIKFATRIPIFMYLTDYRENSLKDVITKLEPDLFKRVTGLTVKDFELLVSLNLFNGEMMNDAIYKFRRYEDSSLEYTGIIKHSKDENVGLYNTVISREEYNQLTAEQTDSMKHKNLILIHDVPDRAFTKYKIYADEDSQHSNNLHAQDQNKNYRVQRVETNESVKSKKFDKRSVHIGTTVLHKKFGIGKVTAITKKNIFVRFDKLGEKQFQFPDVFLKEYLSIK